MFARRVAVVGTGYVGLTTCACTRKRLALLGLTFKASTDDLRDSPAVGVAALLRQAGAELVATARLFRRTPR